MTEFNRHLQKPPTPIAKWSHQVDAYHVRGALIIAVEKYLKAKSGEFRRDVIESSREEALEEESDRSGYWKVEPKKEDSRVKSNAADENSIYQDSYHHFGCSLAAR